MVKETLSAELRSPRERQQRSQHVRAKDRLSPSLGNYHKNDLKINDSFMAPKNRLIRRPLSSGKFSVPKEISLTCFCVSSVKTSTTFISYLALKTECLSRQRVK